MSGNDFWDRLKKRLVEVSTAAADFTEEQATIGKLKFDILTLKRKVDHSLHEIGARVLEMSRTTPSVNPLTDHEVKAELHLIDDLEAQVARKKKEISDVTDQFRRRRDARERQKYEAEHPRQTVRPVAPAAAEPKRRGRKPGSKNVKTAAPAAKPDAVKPAPAKRGRKPKKVEPGEA